jgi:hypothetical protein
MPKAGHHYTGREHESIHCHLCSKTLDIISASVTSAPSDLIYICLGSIKQKIFVYGKYSGGRYGAISFAKTCPLEHCDEKKCEDDISGLLKVLKENEYSRFLSCKDGMMHCVILTDEMIETRKRHLRDGRLADIFPVFNDKRKYFCHDDADKLDFVCSCGDELISTTSDKYSELTGLDDQKFMEDFLPEVLKLK